MASPNKMICDTVRLWTIVTLTRAIETRLLFDNIYVQCTYDVFAQCDRVLSTFTLAI